MSAKTFKRVEALTLWTRRDDNPLDIISVVAQIPPRLAIGVIREQVVDGGDVCRGVGIGHIATEVIEIRGIGTIVEGELKRGVSKRGLTLGPSCVLANKERDRPADSCE